jgi:hypothetical protein
MAKFELKLPKMGESVAEATITNWLKEVGDKIEADEVLKLQLIRLIARCRVRFQVFCGAIICER